VQVLLIGGSGYVGARVNAFLKQRHTLRVFDLKPPADPSLEYRQGSVTDFEALKLTDPVSKESVAWVDYMRMMAGAFTGIGNDLQQGQVENALKNYDAFSARVKALEQEGCAKCHATPRTYFVDPASLALVDKLGEALKASPPDAQAIGELSGAIGNETCMKCHLVHVPAASAKARWEAYADLLK
jgi:hypothetical protein